MKCELYAHAEGKSPPRITATGNKKSLSARIREAPGGLEPPNKGFADLCLTTWLRGRALRLAPREKPNAHELRLVGLRELPARLKRETGFEPATFTLAT